MITRPPQGSKALALGGELFSMIWRGRILAYRCCLLEPSDKIWRTYMCQSSTCRQWSTHYLLIWSIPYLLKIDCSRKCTLWGFPNSSRACLMCGCFAVLPLRLYPRALGSFISSLLLVRAFWFTCLEMHLTKMQHLWWPQKKRYALEEEDMWGWVFYGEDQ